MAVSTSYKELIAELLAPVGAISIKRMFGGAGVTIGGVTFAILADDTLYFKVDDTTRAKYEAEKVGPFTYTSKSGIHALSSYWCCPERLFDEPEDLQAWAREALTVAERAAKTAKPKAVAKPKPAKKPQPKKRK